MILKEFTLEGKVAIVTGAGRGLGKAISLTLAEAGADVVVAARTVQQIEQTAEEVRKLGQKSLAIQTDVGQTEQVEKLAEATVTQFGKIDILVANAGIDVMKPLVLAEGLPPPPIPSIRFDSGLTEQEWDSVLNINLNGIVRCARVVGPHMIKQRKGKIINIGSVNGFKAGVYATPYSTAKAAVHRFTQVLALEWAPFNINVNAIAPGVFGPTEMFWHPEWHVTREECDARVASFPSRIPLGRIGNPREIGLLSVFLASDAADFLTGEIISPNGGTIL